MTLFNRSIAFALVAILSLVGSAFGQTAMTSTTLSTAITTTSSNAIVVASATGITAPTNPAANGSIGGPQTSALTVLMVDKEAMRVTSINGTTIYVQRGFQSVATSHLSGATVWVGPASYYGAYVPSGSCTPNLLQVLPRIVLAGTSPNAGTGDKYTCYSTAAGTSGQWARLGDPYAYYGGSQASIAGAQPVTGSMFGVSGTAAITSFTLPTGFSAGMCFIIIPSAAFTQTATNNIGLATTGVVGKALWECYDGTKVWPSY